MLSENLERRRQEAEELESYCSQLKVTDSGTGVGCREGTGRGKRVGGNWGGTAWVEVVDKYHWSGLRRKPSL